MTVLYPGKICLRHAHHGAGSHQEQPFRLTSIADADEGILNSEIFHAAVENGALQWQHDIEPAKMIDMVRVHEWKYVKHLSDMCYRSEAETDPKSRSARLDTDTLITKESLNASRYAAGAVIAGVDRVANGISKTCFVAARPPVIMQGPVEPGLRRNFGNAPVCAAAASAC